MEENVKTTLAENGMIFFGPGAEELFGFIKETGSVRDAAEQMGMSYSKAWKLIRQAEVILEKKMVERSKGGEGGGGSATLTEEGEKLLSRYRAFDAEVKAAAEEIFRRHFDEK